MSFLEMDEVAKKYEAIRAVQSFQVEPRTEPVSNRKRKRMERSREVSESRGIRPAAFMQRPLMPVFQASRA